MQTFIRFENISKRYTLGVTRSSIPNAISHVLRNLVKPASNSDVDRVLWALRDVSFELKEGQSLGLVGSNGAGKTTILKLLANITKPTSGKYMVSGRLSALIELGSGFHPDLTGRENIFLNGVILGLSRKEIERRFDEIVNFSELDRFIDTPIKRYSSGMIVRLGFAVASCIEPQILLVDEVLAVGDASFQQKCLARIRSLLKNGTSIIFVSHNLYLMQAACNIALYLRKGQVVHFGTLKDAFDLYENDLHHDQAHNLGTASTTDTRSDYLHITHIDILSGDGAKLDVLSSRRPAQIRVHYDSDKPIGKLQLQISITRADGIICCMMRTKLDEFDLIIEKGSGIVTVEINPLQLVGGAYYVEASFLDESDSVVITPLVARSDWFIIQGVALSHNESSIFEPNTIWTHSKNVHFLKSERTH